MKKLILFIITPVLLLLVGCSSNPNNQQGTLLDGMFGSGLSLTNEEIEFIYDLSGIGDGYSSEDWLNERYERDYLMYEKGYKEEGNIPGVYDIYFGLRAIIERGNDWTKDFSSQEKEYIIAAAVKYYLQLPHYWSIEGYIPLKDKIKEELPHLDTEIDEYFQKPRKNEFFGFTDKKKTITCQGYKAASFMQDGIERGFSGAVYPWEVIKGEMDNNNQTFTLKILDNDTIDFYTNLNPGEAVNYKIRTNSPDTIVAESNSGALLDNIIISKKTGLGLWTKSSASGMPMYYEVPYGVMTYIYCDVAN